MIIAGLGSQEITPAVNEQLRRLGGLCRERGIWVRTGHNPGADTAWEEGAREQTLVYLPGPGFGSNVFHTPHVFSLPDSERRFGNPHDIALLDLHARAVARAVASLEDFPPRHGELHEADRQRLTRDYFRVMGGEREEKPVEAIVLWEAGQEGEIQGCSEQAVRIANAHGIPVFNLAECEVVEVEFLLMN